MNKSNKETMIVPGKDISYLQIFSEKYFTILPLEGELFLQDWKHIFLLKQFQIVWIFLIQILYLTQTCFP